MSAQELCDYLECDGHCVSKIFMVLALVPDAIMDIKIFLLLLRDVGLKSGLSHFFLVVPMLVNANSMKPARQLQPHVISINEEAEDARSKQGVCPHRMKVTWKSRSCSFSFEESLRN